jgi:hypothetical protein
MNDNAKPARPAEVNPAPCPECGRYCSDRCGHCDYRHYIRSVAAAHRLIRMRELAKLYQERREALNV